MVYVCLFIENASCEMSFLSYCIIIITAIVYFWVNFLLSAVLLLVSAR